MPFDDVGGIVADAEIESNPTVAPPAVDGMEHLRSEPVRFRALFGLRAELLAARPGGRKAGFHAFAEQVTFELRDPGHHPPVRRIELERHAAHRDYGDLSVGAGLRTSGS